MTDLAPQCDYENPSSVVTAFITAMNGWEFASWRAHRACRDSDNPGAYQTGVVQELNRIFAAFCTPKERRQGRGCSFQRPPEYDPARETVVTTVFEETRRRAYVTTQRDAVLGGGAYRYTLFMWHGKWLIDNVKYEEDGVWRSEIL
jgi:NTF2 fold immunity protein